MRAFFQMHTMPLELWFCLFTKCGVPAGSWSVSFSRLILNFGTYAVATLLIAVIIQARSSFWRSPRKPYQELTSLFFEPLRSHKRPGTAQSARIRIGPRAAEHGSSHHGFQQLDIRNAGECQMKVLYSYRSARTCPLTYKKKGNKRRPLIHSLEIHWFSKAVS